MKNKQKQKTNFETNKKMTIIVLAIAAIILLLGRVVVVDKKEQQHKTGDYVEYEVGKINQILADNCQPDENADGAYRGEQLLIVNVTSGQYKGKQMQAYNYVSPLYNTPLKVNDNVVLIISTYENGKVNASVYEFSRFIPLVIVLALFIVVNILIGGKTGVKSLISLLFTILCLFLVLIPALLKGAPVILTTYLVAIYITIVSLVLLNGVCKKTIGSAIGSISGITIAIIFSFVCQWLTKINGLREADTEALLQMRQTGEAAIGLKGLLIGGIIISCLGAVMDVTMGIASSMQEVAQANPDYSFKQLVQSGLNVGKDMVGTMTNTLILAFLGSEFTYIIYLFSLSLSFHQLISSSYMAVEMISALASCVGIILSIPITALASGWVFTKKAKLTNK